MGRKNHRRLGHAHEQGARVHRGHASLRRGTARDRDCRPIPRASSTSMVEFEGRAPCWRSSPSPTCVWPIQYALTYPERRPSLTERLDLKKNRRSDLCGTGPFCLPVPENRARRGENSRNGLHRDERGQRGGRLPSSLRKRSTSADIGECVFHDAGQDKKISKRRPLDDILAADAEARRLVCQLYG